MSRKLFAIATLSLGAAALLAAPRPAQARPHPAHARSFTANKTFGLGLMLGAPSGLSGKWFIGPSTAIDFGLGDYYALGYYYSGFEFHADFLWHPVSLASTSAFELPLYLGIGGHYYDHDYNYQGIHYANSHFGLRAPIGLAFDFNRVPLDIFGELALVVDFYNGNYPGERRVDLDGAIGIRYWFE